MKAISSFRDICTMRVLILSAAVLACASAAPSGAFFAPIYPSAPIVYSAVVIPAAVPTISPGDLQAAAIDAKVQVEDHVRAAADRARELTEQAIEKQNEGIVEANDLAKEKAEESFWAAEEKKWQAMDALKTAEAQVDGSVAKMASVVSKAAESVPVDVAAESVPVDVAAESMPTDVAAQTEGIENSVSVVAAETKSAAPEESKVEEQNDKAEGEGTAAVDAASDSKPIENAEKPVEAVQAEIAQSPALAKAAEAVKEEIPAAVSLTQLHQAPVVSTAYVTQPWLNPGIAPISYIPGFKTYVPSLIPNYNSQFLNPTYYSTVW